MTRAPRVLALLSLALLAPVTTAATAARCQSEEVASGDPHAELREKCAARLESLIESRLPGASAALVLPGGEVVAVAAGLASREDGQPLTPDHRLLAGSTGKTFVTAAIHELVEAGELDLDARAASYFDGEPAWVTEAPNAREFTLRQLLRHQSGLPRYVFQPEFSGTLAAEPDRRWEPVELLSFVYDERPLFAPGEGWAYADTGYIVLGMVIEEVTGGTYYDYVREHFIEPFELVDTVATDSRSIPRMAQGHVVTGRQMGIPARTLVDGAFTYNVQFEWCGGGFASTPRDLARWARLLYAGEALEGDYLDSLLEGVPAEGLGPGARYGLGVILRDTPAGPALGHEGFMPGYLTAMAWFPEARIGAALQLNADDGAAVGKPLVLVLAELVALAAD